MMFALQYGGAVNYSLKHIHEIIINNQCATGNAYNVIYDEFRFYGVAYRCA